MKRLAPLLTCCLMTTHCATVVTDSPPPKAFAPEGYYSEGRSGVVVYNPNGIKELADRNREAAFEKMYQFCGSTNQYEIVKEETVDTKDVAGADAALATMAANPIRRIEFRCLAKTGKTP